MKHLPATAVAIALGLVLCLLSVASAEREADAPPPPQQREASPADTDSDADTAADRGDRDRGHWRDRMRPQPLSDEDAEEALSIIAELKPEAAERLRALRAEDPRRFAGELRGRFPRLGYLLRLKQADPAMYELRVSDMKLAGQSMRLAQAWRTADAAGEADKADDLREQLAAVAADHFAVRQEIRAAELRKLEERLEALRDELEQRQADRDTIIEDHIERLLREREARRHRDRNPSHDRGEL